MKFPLLLSILLLSASPTLAEGILYLKCTGNLVSKVSNADTSELMQKNEGRHSKSYVVDLERRKVMSMGGQWMNAEIIDGVLTASGMTGRGLSTSEETIGIIISPIGEYTYQQSVNRRNITMDIDAAGDCEEVDASVLTGDEQ